MTVERPSPPGQPDKVEIVLRLMRGVRGGCERNGSWPLAGAVARDDGLDRQLLSRCRSGHRRAPVGRAGARVSLFRHVAVQRVINTEATIVTFYLKLNEVVAALKGRQQPAHQRRGSHRGRDP